MSLKPGFMDHPKRIFSYLFPSVGNIIFLLIFLHFSFFTGQGLLADGDTGYHIRAGQYILENFSIPKHDIFSYHTPPIPWTAHEWLSEVIMAWIHNYFGLNGIVFFFSFLISLIFYILFRFIRAHDGNIIISTLLVILAALTSSLHWLARPHIYSLLLMLIWYFMIDEYQYRNRNLIFLFPFMMLLWVNLHGGFITGFLFLGIYFLGNSIGAITSDGEKKNVCKKKAKYYLFIIALCLITTLINPYGHQILLFPFSFISNKFLMDNVAEFLSPNFHSPEVLIFEIFLLFTITIFLVSMRRLNPIEVLLFIFFTHMSFYSIRYIPLFSLIISPILSKKIGFLIQESNTEISVKFLNKSKKYADIDQICKGFLWPGMGLLLSSLGIALGIVNFQFDEKIKPIKAVEFIKTEHIKGNMFNNDEFGDIIIYSAFPQYKVFFDGRSDMYGNEKIKEYKKVLEFKPGWEDIIKKYKIQWIFFDNDSPLSRYLLERSDWKLIFSDKVANIFLKNTPEFANLIEKYKNVKPYIKDESDGKK